MRWGVRRYQNEDGTLTPAGKIRYAKLYEKYDKAGTKELMKAQSGFQTRARIEQVLATQDSDWNKKVGRSINREAHGDNAKATKIYNDALAKVYKKSLAKQVADFHETNKNLKKAQELVNKYGMTEWNELARMNTENLEGLKKLVSR